MRLSAREKRMGQSMGQRAAGWVQIPLGSVARAGWVQIPLGSVARGGWVQIPLGSVVSAGRRHRRLRHAARFRSQLI